MVDSISSATGTGLPRNMMHAAPSITFPMASSYAPQRQITAIPITVTRLSSAAVLSIGRWL